MITNHDFCAEWIEGKGCIVTDSRGNQIKVEYGATLDLCCATAYIPGVGFIGGWQRRTNAKRGFPFKCIIASINRGKLYSDMNELPKFP